MISKSNVKAWMVESLLQHNAVVLIVSKSKQCIIKQLLDSVFVISGIIKVSVSVISLSLLLRLITLTSVLIIPDITKTSSNNCLLSYLVAVDRNLGYNQARMAITCVPSTTTVLSYYVTTPQMYCFIKFVKSVGPRVNTPID